MVAVAAGGAGAVARGETLARERRDPLAFDAAPAAAAAPAGPRLPADAVWLYGALARSAQMAGGLDYVLRQASQYATERRQFGKPIGAFQVIQQNLAVLAGHTAAAGTAAANAFRAADRGDPAFEIAVAKVRVGEAAGVGASIAHQVHGAIGFTYEHALQFVTRAPWAGGAPVGGGGDPAAAVRGAGFGGRGPAPLAPPPAARPRRAPPPPRPASCNER